MAWNLTDKEYEAVKQLSAPDRYEYSIKKFADWEVVWSLASDDGWAVMGDDAGHECLVVWPHSRYARDFTTDHWANKSLQPIALDEWLDDWLPGMEKDGLLVAVFPVPLVGGVVVTPSTMKDDLLAELEWYE